MKDKAQFLLTQLAVYYILRTTENFWIFTIIFFLDMAYLWISDSLAEEKWERKIEKVRRENK